jgi:predicted AlkP superfamily phosphohydrolase/phosphomutase
MAEDTWAVEEGIITEEAFLDQVYQYQQERERVFFDSLKKYRTGLTVGVFEATDRIQHVFWRYQKDSGSRARKESTSPRVTRSIYEVYREMDRLTGEIMAKVKSDELLIIVSDHGFNTVRREFDLNSWLKKEGYLKLKEGKETSGKFYADVDWSRTRVYAQGLNGIYLNIKSREKEGIVTPGKPAEKLKGEIKTRLLALKDPETGENIFGKVYTREEIYQGAYVKNAPDIVLGYNVGYRVSWESAVNYVGNEVHKYSERLWSGDHCFHNEAVKGIFFSNYPIQISDPRLQDISPTVLSAFGIKPPAFVEGRNLISSGESERK